MTQTHSPAVTCFMFSVAICSQGCTKTTRAHTDHIPGVSISPVNRGVASSRMRGGGRIATPSSIPPRASERVHAGTGRTRQRQRSSGGAESMSDVHPRTTPPTSTVGFVVVARRTLFSRVNLVGRASRFARFATAAA